MRKRYLKFLSEEEMQKIHNASLAVLEQTGMRIDHRKARELLQDAGAQVDHENKVVKFPNELIEKYLESCPKELFYGGRYPDDDLVVKAGSEELYGRCTVGGTHYEDLRTGAYRRATGEDIKEVSVVIDALPNIISCGGIFAEDFPVHTADIHCAQLMFENQRKHVVVQAFTQKQLKYVIEMSLAIRGDRERLRQRPLFTCVGAIISPLFLSEEDVDMLLLAGEYGVPMALCTQANAGATGPITLAGNLVVGNAELLGNIALSQLAHPGHQVVYVFIPGVTDMTTGTAIFGGPENTIMTACLNQMGEVFYGIPTAQGAGEVDGVIFEQTQFQRAYKILTAALSGGSFITNLGSIDAAVGHSPVQLVIDDEIIEMTRIICTGIEINDDTLGLDAIHRVGPQGHFLADEHTLRHLRSSVLFKPQIFDRDPYEIWLSKGAKNWEQKAREKALTILKEHKVPPLDENVVKELSAIVEKADEELAQK